MTKFLEVFVKELLAMNSVNWKAYEGELTSSVQIVYCCVDAPARAAVLNWKQFNGYFGCSFCLHKGSRYQRSVKYPVGNQVPAARTTSQVKEDMQLALATGVPSRGVKGYTPLVELPKFDLVWGVGPGYMHCVLEEVAKQLADTWFSSVKSPSYIGAPSQLRSVTSRLLNLKPPQFFTRLPRTVEDRSLWKASEWKWWLLFLCCSMP
ncbi:hypothetical protein MTO96_018540 [Rhipicephalus appendiculatus]